MRRVCEPFAERAVNSGCLLLTHFLLSHDAYEPSAGSSYVSSRLTPLEADSPR